MITVKVDTRNARTAKKELVTTGSVGIPVKFIFSEEWNGLGRTAVFSDGTITKDVILTSDQCIIPHECLAVAGRLLTLGIYGTDGEDVVIPTIECPLERIYQGADPSGDPSIEPTPSAVDQILAAAQNAVEVAQSVRDDADDGLFDGEDGTDGIDGVSPAVTVTATAQGHIVKITDKDHPSGQSFTVTNGTDGEDGTDGVDGVSPTVTVEDIPGGHRVKITDKDHPAGQSIDVLNGTDGTDGQDGEDGKSAYEAAQDGGYTGTEQQFNMALAGIQLLAEDVSSIEGKISDAASSTNKLVSASEMGDAIEAVEAKQIYATASQGSFATKAELISATTFFNADGTVATPTKNDVVYVLADESHGGKSAKYVIASVAPIIWGFVITFSDTTFSQSQMDAINSGATVENISSIAGKYVKPPSGIPKTDLASGVKESLDKADSALQEHQSLSAYSTTAQMTEAIDAHHDSSKQDRSMIKSAIPANNILEEGVEYRLGTISELIIEGFGDGAEGYSELWSVAFTAGSGISVSVPASVAWAVATPVFEVGRTYWLSFTPIGVGYLGVWSVA